MRTMNRSVVPVVLASVVGGAAGLTGWGTSLAADPAPIEKTVLAAAAGAVAANDAASEAVVFSGQATISGKVIYDTVFGAPPILEIIVDLSTVKGKGARTGTAYLVSSQAILHRPLVAFDPIEVAFSFAANGNTALARSATASFGVYYNAVTGMTTTPVRVVPQVPH